VKFLDAQAVRRQVFLCMHQLFERLARRQPVVVVLEDRHWVDPSTVSLCEHLVPHTDSHALTFWLTTRADPGEPAQRIKVAASRNVDVRLQEIALAALAEADSGALMDNLVGASVLPEAIRGQILRKTGGNPFFIEEVVRALIADGTLAKETRKGSWRLAKPVADLALPDTIVARIDRLEESVKSVLKLASVIGRSFFLRILEAIAEAGDAVDSGLGQLEEMCWPLNAGNFSEKRASGRSINSSSGARFTSFVTLLFIVWAMSRSLVLFVNRLVSP
jgi:predicted ATPase